MTGGDRVPGSSAGAGGSGNDAGDPEEQAPIGTLFVMMVYLMVLAGMWGTMYWLLVSS